jgi:DNA-binding transcriptional LysR family regulator
MVELAGIHAFLELARTGNVLAAARNLTTSRATVRRRLEALERALGRPLLERQRGQLVPTRVGRLLEREGGPLVAAARRLEGALRQSGSEDVSGTLSVALPNGLPGPLFTLFARELAERWPKLEVVSVFTAHPLLELERDADLAISVGQRPGEPWVARLLTELNERAIAHRSYLERAGLPRALADLKDHRLLSWSTPESDGRSWPLRRSGAHRIRPALITNDLRMLQECIEGGLGIGFVPIGPMIEGLQVVLPAMLGRRQRFWLATAPASRWSPMVRAFAQALSAFLNVTLGRA